jgi:UDP-N-acetylglucosamine:LPS N-acetylglucosamine transferase
MKSTFKIFLLCFLLCIGSVQLRAQDDQQTRANALEREKAAKALKQAEYDAHREHISDLQGKKVQKRMKKNLKKSQRISQGRQIPWYKRIFRKKRIR